ncbi:MAG: hypothetical protein JWM21_4941 [Acidobacteria bacterium]|nr:hypothetical protein [Acidobacteriota bacterium]
MRVTEYAQPVIQLHQITRSCPALTNGAINFRSFGSTNFLIRLTRNRKSIVTIRQNPQMRAIVFGTVGQISPAGYLWTLFADGISRQLYFPLDLPTALPLF